jgi:nucleotide-binding universal stress UspA family protein
LRYALSLAQELESRLSVLNVRDSAPGTADGWFRNDIERLRATAPVAAGLWCDTHAVSVVGDPPAALASVAAVLQPDLIVVGASGTSPDSVGAMARAALGVDGADVLIVPPPASRGDVAPAERARSQATARSRSEHAHSTSILAP